MYSAIFITGSPFKHLSNSELYAISGAFGMTCRRDYDIKGQDNKFVYRKRILVCCASVSACFAGTFVATIADEQSQRPLVLFSDKATE